ncbi:Hypothetical predicted protein [Octopus vulgaris]|uniref:Uncharacterized protein n=1 Tax=Octopus vulgaris TaxID=6645 RepID=A0AA36BZG9_OCTVU|nr:Hypothetical predicted protein [Octopus vulgaris]
MLLTGHWTETKFLSLSVFPSWFLKLPIASSHNYKMMDLFKLVLLLLMTCAVFTNTYPKEITEIGIAVRNRNFILRIKIPNIRQPVVWLFHNYKYECDRTCADGPDYEVANSGGTPTLWIKDVTKKCLTWKFDEDNQNAADNHLKINSLTNAYTDEITKIGIAVNNGNVTMTITLPNMKRPLFWKCDNYKYECDRTCADGPYYKVAHVGNTSTLFIKDVTKNCLTWEFDDDNQNAADIHLKIKDPKTEDDGSRPYSTLEIFGIIAVVIIAVVIIAAILVGLSVFGYNSLKKKRNYSVQQPC